MTESKMNSLYYYSYIRSCHSLTGAFDSTKCFCPGQHNGAQLALEPETLHLDFFLLFSAAAHGLHRFLLPSPPSPTAPTLSFVLSLALTQWAISVMGGFYLCSQAGCRHGAGCSAPEDYVLVRAYATERPHLRPVQVESLFPDPTPDLRPENSLGIARLQPSSEAIPLFEGEQILLSTNIPTDMIGTGTYIHSHTNTWRHK